MAAACCLASGVCTGTAAPSGVRSVFGSLFAAAQPKGVDTPLNVVFLAVVTVASLLLIMVSTPMTSCRLMHRVSTNLAFSNAI